MKKSKHRARRYWAAARGLGGRVAGTLSAARNFLKGKEEGASLVEYLLLVGLLTLVCLLGMAAIGGAIGTLFNNLANNFTSPGS